MLNKLNCFVVAVVSVPSHAVGRSTKFGKMILLIVVDSVADGLVNGILPAATPLVLS